MNFIDYSLNRFESLRSKLKINPYIFGIFVFLLGFLIEIPINLYIHQQAYLVLVISLALTAWYGGFFPCLFVTIVGFLIIDFFILPPVHSFFATTPEYIRGAIFLVEGVFFGIVGESRKRREKEINRAYESERKAHKQADEAIKTRDEFIAMASHELKSPITSQKIYLQLLEKKLQAYKRKDIHQYVQKINNKTENIEKLINDLLGIAKIRAGKLTMNFATFNFAQWLYNVVEEVQITNPTYKISIQGSSTKSVYADKEKLTEVLSNLLSNAIKYSPRTKKIIVSIKEHRKNLEIGVTDYGIGISKTIQNKLFTKYFRAEGASEKTYKGFGMGLFIVSEIIKQHKGKIWVKSKEGKGSTFSFSIPIEK